MQYPDLLGFTLEEALKILKEDNFQVNIYEAKGLNKNFTKDLFEPRIIKLEFIDSVANIIVSYF